MVRGWQFPKTRNIFLAVDLGRRTNPAAVAAGVVGLVALLALLAFIFDLGPFSDDELSVPEFLSQADEICTEAHDEFLELQDRTPRTPEDAANLTEALVEVAREEADAVAELDAPASLEDPVDGYLQEREKGIELLRDGVAAARDEDPEEYESIQARLDDSQSRRAASAREIGFSECSKPLER